MITTLESRPVVRAAISKKDIDFHILMEKLGELQQGLRERGTDVVHDLDSLACPCPVCGKPGCIRSFDDPTNPFKASCSRFDDLVRGDWALRYAGCYGFYVLPVWWARLNGRCACGNAECRSRGKHPIAPLVPHGVCDATDDLDTIVGWWTRCPWANIGVRTGTI